MARQPDSVHGADIGAVLDALLVSAAVVVVFAIFAGALWYADTQS